MAIEREQLLPVYALLRTHRWNAEAIDQVFLDMEELTRDDVREALNIITQEDLWRELARELGRGDTATKLASKYGLPPQYFEQLQEGIRPVDDDPDACPSCGSHVPGETGRLGLGTFGVIESEPQREFAKCPTCDAKLERDAGEPWRPAR
jgi:hypothetical protein